MTDILFGIAPVIMIFFVGLALRLAGIFRKEHVDDFIKLVFYVSLPGLIMNSMLNTELKMEFVYLPLISAIIIFCMYGLSYFIGKLFKLPKTSLGVFIIGTMILNNGLVLPFIVEAYGDEGLARLIIFDFSNAFLAFTFVYYNAIRFGRSRNEKSIPYKKFLFSPPIWALILGIILNLTKTEVPVYLTNFFGLLGDLTIPLLMLAIGIFFTPKTVRFYPLFTAILIRSGIGLLLGFLFVYLFDLSGLSRIVVLISASAPIGFNTITFASLEKLDKEFAASLVSFAILIGLVMIPVLIFIFNY